jgi:hypothetical protein
VSGVSDGKVNSGESLLTIVGQPTFATPPRLFRWKTALLSGVIMFVNLRVMDLIAK